MPQTIDNMSVTWTNSLTTYTGIKLNAAGSSDANSAAGSLLMDLQVGGSSKFRVSKTGSVAFATNLSLAEVLSGFGFYYASNLPFHVNASHQAAVRSDGAFVFSSTSAAGQTPDLFLTRRAAANLRLGAADAAAPVAQTLSVQSVVAGTTNTAGANLTITGSQGTGTGAGGSIVFQVAPAGSSGTAQNALSSLLTLSTTGMKVNGAVSKVVFEVENQTYPDFRMPTFSLQNGSAAGLWFYTEPGMVSFGTGANLDIKFYRDAANTLALRNGANAQTFNVYKSYTDASNYSRLAMYASGGGNFIISSQVAGTGAGGIMYVSNTTEHAINFQTNNSDRWTITGSGGHLLAGTDNLYDIGASGATRPRNLFLANNITIGGTNITSAAGGTWSQPSTLEMATGGHIRWASRSRVYSTADGVIALLDSTAAAGSSLEMSEMTAPAAPATNGVRIYAEDNGSGKTRLMARFATGAAVQIAIEP